MHTITGSFSHILLCIFHRLDMSNQLVQSLPPAYHLRQAFKQLQPCTQVYLYSTSCQWWGHCQPKAGNSVPKAYLYSTIWFLTPFVPVAFPRNRFHDGNFHAGDLLGKGRRDGWRKKLRSDTVSVKTSVLMEDSAGITVQSSPQLGGNGSYQWLITHTDQSLNIGHLTWECTLNNMTVYSHGSSPRRML